MNEWSINTAIIIHKPFTCLLHDDCLLKKNPSVLRVFAMIMITPYIRNLVLYPTELRAHCTKFITQSAQPEKLARIIS